MKGRIATTSAAALRLEGAAAGFTLVELMIAMTISLLLMSALVSVFVNSSRSSSELAKTNAMIDNGRSALLLLETDLEHAGFWGGYIPQFDDLTSTVVPGDVPTIVPNPCKTYATWDGNYVTAAIGIPVQSYDALPAGAGCLAPLVQRAGTDVLVVRHSEVCLPGAANCDPNVAGALYFQTSFCAAEQNAGTAQGGSATTITLSAGASTTLGAYVGLMLRTTGGTGAGQFAQVSSYGAGQVATVNDPWAVVPDNTTTYAFSYVLGTTAFPLYQRNCVGTGTPPATTLPITGGTISNQRKFISNIYYISNFPNPDYPGQVIPTLVRSPFDLAGGVLAQQAPVPLIDGVEGFRVVIGVDDVSKTGAPVDYTAAVNWANPNNLVLPTNRGDGVPDVYVRCTTAAPCTLSQLMNAVAVKVYMLVRDRDPTLGYVDPKTYCLGEPNANGSCPAASQYTPNDAYKRHMYVTTVRINNVAGRRETPP
jgi:prepilin-type N-terminal cleavage/methylation domain-containing protein